MSDILFNSQFLEQNQPDFNSFEGFYLNDNQNLDMSQFQLNKEDNNNKEENNDFSYASSIISSDDGTYLNNSMNSNYSMNSNETNYLPISAPQTNKRQHDHKSFQCTTCSATFKRSHDLRRHHRSVHSDVKPYNCRCGKRFARQDALKRHVSRKRPACIHELPILTKSNMVLPYNFSETTDFILPQLLMN